ncbi:MAG: hypothetical protein EOO61_10340 [Hymenobacter sp.]|nr:MAG: hypothetical protein EOO61_10340 [Hymenobacter sp.]
MKKPKLGLPPTRVPNTSVEEMISKGGSVASEPLRPPTVPPVPEEDKLKSFTFKIYESELAQIRAIQDALPKRDRISIHDFVLAAVKEKIKQGGK